MPKRIKDSLTNILGIGMQHVLLRSLKNGKQQLGILEYLTGGRLENVTFETKQGRLETH